VNKKERNEIMEGYEIKRKERTKQEGRRKEENG
jgi:hypothetical protein